MAAGYANPWTELPTSSSAPLWKVHRTWSRPFNLFGLPNELIYMIVEYLPRESRAALALVNYFFKDLLGPSAIDFTPASRLRFTFLRLLERDLNDRVACPCCQMLHHPRVKDCKRRLFGHDEPIAFHLFQDRPLPVGLCYNTVRAAAIRQARLGADPSLDFGPDTRHFLHKCLKIVRTSRTWFVDGTLITRVQTIIALDRSTTREWEQLIQHPKIIRLEASDSRRCKHGWLCPRFSKYLHEGENYSDANVKIERCHECATESADWYNLLPGVGPVICLTA
ncbi:hypothetical protein QBC40DRAFT_331986 [Triangularia verruculosa]|uniref:F-box domain-containing protein n=1 Tax=Triangularia verruculosa TaxID=2587418 RepID=A0AAN6XGE7_9PEZI|nr:hypothetical protein QBC40DRAFT_331986 [Triangularia verruculosa]